jgi:deoxyribonuclease V
MTEHLVRRVGVVDVHYPASGGAQTALVIASGRGFGDIVQERVRWLAEVAAYRPGDFFLRELPAITAVLAAHLYRQIQIPVVGVVKTAFHTATHAAAVHCGTATRPLYLTAVGISIDRAAALVTHMADALGCGANAYARTGCGCSTYGAGRSGHRMRSAIAMSSRWPSGPTMERWRSSPGRPPTWTRAWSSPVSTCSTRTAA